MKTDKLVQNEVYYNVSMLINELQKDDKYIDDLIEISVKDDYLTALEEVSNSGIKEALEWIGYDSLDDLDENEIREVAEYLDIEPYQNEALEHWIVSDYLADKLESFGEMVVRDFLGLTIWGRTTSGQSISLDYVIKKISEL